jgi:hypothetical protein
LHGFACTLGKLYSGGALTLASGAKDCKFIDFKSARHAFELPPTQLARFVEALDRPAKAVPACRDAAPIEWLAYNHGVSQLNCGKHASLADCIMRFARMISKPAIRARIHRGFKVIGYYSLALLIKT